MGSSIRIHLVTNNKRNGFQFIKAVIRVTVDESLTRRLSLFYTFHRVEVFNDDFNKLKANISVSYTNELD